jgi:hypothetical protein
MFLIAKSMRQQMNSTTSVLMKEETTAFCGHCHQRVTTQASYSNSLIMSVADRSSNSVRKKL